MTEECVHKLIILQDCDGRKIVGKLGESTDIVELFKHANDYIKKEFQNKDVALKEYKCGSGKSAWRAFDSDGNKLIEIT